MKTVLFVCVHNAGRSQMAEAFTNRISAELHLPVRALSAGTAAGERINPVAQAVMAEIGIPLDGQSPKQLTQQMADQADRIITMGCGVDAEACPARIFVSEDWGLEDPAGQPIVKVRQIRDQIRERVEGLLEAMVEAEYKDGQPGIPVVCNPAAFDATQQQRHRELISRLKKAVQEIHDLSDGYTFRFPAEPEVCQ